MSEDKKEETPKEVKEIIEKHEVNLKRTAAEKELQKELEGKAVEVSKLQDQLREKVTELQKLADEKQTTTDQFDNLKTERDNLKGQLQEIAMAEFNRQKQDRLKTLKDSGFSEKQIEEFDEKVKSPADLDATEWMLGMFNEALKKSKDEGGEGGEGNAPPPVKIPDGGSLGTPPAQVPGSPTMTGGAQSPPRSVVRLPGAEEKQWQFQSIREGIDALYRKEREGDPEATRMLNQLWGKAIQLLKKDYNKLSFAVTQCPVCGAGILANEKCPFCEFDPETYRTTGGEFW